jgi:hemin uptake protein HemP
MRAMTEQESDLSPEPPADSPPAPLAAGSQAAGRYQPPPPPIRLFRSEELFGGGRIVCIEHAGSTYRLQITARGKLILQK